MKPISRLLKIQHSRTHLRSKLHHLNQIGISSTPLPVPLVTNYHRVSKVTFIISPAAQSSSKKAQDSIKHSSVEPTALEIASLCQSLQNHRPSDSCLGFLQDDDKRFYVYAQPQTSTQDVESPVSLDQLLRQSFQPSLNRRQRYSLALALSSSFLQLRPSPWLQSPWKKEEIAFFRDPIDSKAILLDKPHITTDFTTSAPASGTDDRSAFASLGVILLELCFGTIIDTHPVRLKFPAGDELTKPSFDLLAAVEWQREVGEEAGPDYASAVDWCLLRSRKLGSDSDWRRGLLREVVQPLERCHKYLHAGTY